MTVYMNDIEWDVVTVPYNSPKLVLDNGERTVGVTDNDTKKVYLSELLRGDFFYKVLCHELVHVASFSYECEIPIETEEIIADFFSLYGDKIYKNADNIMKELYCKSRINRVS